MSYECFPRLTAFLANRSRLMQQLEEDQRVLQTEVMRSGDSSCNLPVNLRRLIENAQRNFGCYLHKRGPTGACTLRTALHCTAGSSTRQRPPPPCFHVATRQSS